jgi:hypothetical protein
MYVRNARSSTGAQRKGMKPVLIVQPNHISLQKSITIHNQGDYIAALNQKIKQRDSGVTVGSNLDSLPPEINVLRRCPRGPSTAIASRPNHHTTLGQVGWIATLIIACLLSILCLSYATDDDVDGFILLPGATDSASLPI